jgi:hypothetical protein
MNFPRETLPQSARDDTVLGLMRRTVTGPSVVSAGPARFAADADALLVAGGHPVVVDRILRRNEKAAVA